VCTATLIAPRVLITAAHCVAAFPAQSLDFTLDASATGRHKPAGVFVRRAYLNPEYHLRASDSLHDIALLELETPLKGLTAERVLHPADAAALLRSGVRVQLVGYGTTHARWRILGREERCGSDHHPHRR
jgi:V8-like Glu-specific endopeptidase